MQKKLFILYIVPAEKAQEFHADKRSRAQPSADEQPSGPSGPSTAEHSRAQPSAADQPSAPDQPSGPSGPSTAEHSRAQPSAADQPSAPDQPSGPSTAEQPGDKKRFETKSFETRETFEKERKI